MEKEFKTVTNSFNFLLLRSDFHNLWDRGCISIAQDGKIVFNNKEIERSYKDQNIDIDKLAIPDEQINQERIRLLKLREDIDKSSKKC
jgi:hypothetical protein